MNKQLLITGHVFELEKDCMCKYQGCEKMLKCMRWFLLSITVLGLSGCATNCNIFSGSNSLACDAKLPVSVKTLHLWMGHIDDATCQCAAQECAVSLL